jgi:glycerophosphoryl diester phosphodiesterase
LAEVKILVHGHRGAKAVMPENTLSGFEYAIRHGVDAIEMDLVVTTKNELVISHDPLPERSGAPTLEDVFSLAHLADFQFDLEIKTWRGPPACPKPHEFARLVLDRVRAYNLKSRVAVLSFDFGVLAAMREAAPEIRLSALTEYDPRDFREIAAEAAGAEIVSPQFLQVTPQKVQAAHAAGLQVVPWTVNLPPDWDRLIAANVDGIVTDDPARLLAHLKSRG